MKHSIHLKGLVALGFATLLSSLLAASVFALCGDTNSDQSIDSSDALRTLKKAVGQNVNLTCTNSPDPPSNKVGISNTMACNGLGFFLTMTWSEHPEQEWSAYSDTVFPVEPQDVKAVNDLLLAGTLRLDYEDCGSDTIELDAAFIEYRLPNHSVTNFIFQYEDALDEVFLFVAVTPNPLIEVSSTAALPSPVKKILVGHFTPPRGLSRLQ